MLERSKPSFRRGDTVKQSEKGMSPIHFETTKRIFVFFEFLGNHTNFTSLSNPTTTLSIDNLKSTFF